MKATIVEKTPEAPTKLAEGADRQGRQVFLRYAQLSDSEAIWRWRQDMDPAFARAQRSPSLDEHMRWISAALQDPDRFLYILEEGETEDGEGAAAGGGAGNGDQPPGRPLGHIRLDRVGENAMVSIILAPEERGRGLGRVVLKSIESSAMESGFHTILAEIHISNIASLRTFLAAGYVETGMRGDFAQLSREILQTGSKRAGDPGFVQRSTTGQFLAGNFERFRPYNRVQSASLEWSEP